MTTIDQDIFCQDCGYNLRALTGERCPECGRSLEGLRDTVSRIPWVHRKEIGRFKAYWKTVFFVMFRQRQFCDEMVRPVNYGDSQKFRWITITIAMLPVLAFVILTWNKSWTLPYPLGSFVVNNYLERLGVMAAIFLFLIVMSGIPSYFCCLRSVPLHLQNRSIALSYYLSAPLIFLTVPSTATAIESFTDNDKIIILVILSAIAFTILASTLWLTQFEFLYARLCPGKRGKSIFLTLTMPLVGLIAFLILFSFVLFFIISVVLIFRIAF